MRKPKQQWILQLIRESGSRGINTNELRTIAHTVDVPKIVSILNEKSVRIVSERQKDGTATYKLIDQQKQKKYVLDESTQLYHVVYI